MAPRPPPVVLALEEVEKEAADAKVRNKLVGYVRALLLLEADQAWMICDERRSLMSYQARTRRNVFLGWRVALETQSQRLLLECPRQQQKMKAV